MQSYVRRGLFRRKMSDRLSVRLFVCPFVKRQYSVDMVIRILKVFFTSGSHTILVFPYETVSQYSDGGLPPNGASNARRMKKWRL